MSEKQGQLSLNEATELKENACLPDSFVKLDDYEVNFAEIKYDENLSIAGKFHKLESLRDKLISEEDHQKIIARIRGGTRGDLDDLMGDIIPKKTGFDNESENNNPWINVEQIKFSKEKKNNFSENLNNIIHNKFNILNFNKKIESNQRITKEDYKDIYEFILADNADFMTSKQKELTLNYFKNNKKERQEFIEFVSIHNKGATSLLMLDLVLFDFEDSLNDILSKSRGSLSKEELEFLKNELKEQIKSQEKSVLTLDRAKFLEDFLQKIQKNSKFNGENLKKFILKANELKADSHKYELLQDNKLYNLGVDIPKEKDPNPIILKNQKILLANIDVKIKKLEEENLKNPSDDILEDIADYKKLKENLEKFTGVKIDQERVKTFKERDFSVMAHLISEGKSDKEIMTELEKGNSALKDFNQKTGFNLSQKEVNLSNNSSINFSSSTIYAPNSDYRGDFFGEIFKNLDAGRDGEIKTVSYNDGFSVNISKEGDRYNVKYGDRTESCNKDEVKNVISMGRYMNQMGLGFLFGGINKILYKINQKGNGKINELDGLEYEEKILGLKSIGEALIPGFDSTNTDIKELEKQFNPLIFNNNIRQMRTDKSNKLPKKLADNNGEISSLFELAKVMYPGDSKGKDFSIDSFIKNI
ncbi:hypothetical protein M0P65_02195 [Candidatus Gracilibacteria bacterium]|nr:hypothetical protein [Candidatus Gracilibacteria bacterium]